jgi:hypothetical protein
MSPEPRAFDLSRLGKALRANLRALLAVAALALFGGALVGRLTVPNQVVARATARIARDPHVAVAGALDDGVLDAARRRAGSKPSFAAGSTARLDAAALRERLRIGFQGPDRLSVELAIGPEGDTEGARVLADALVETYVALANERVAQQSAHDRRRHDGELELARAENQRAQTALAVALAREGVPNLEQQLDELRRQVERAEREAEAASLEASGGQERVLAINDLSAEPSVQQAPQALANAQRELSRALAQSGDDSTDVAPLRARIKQLQARTLELGSHALQRQVEARAQGARARELAQQLVAKRGSLARLQEVSARVAPLSALAARESAHLAELEARTGSLAPTASELTSRVSTQARLTVIERRGLRLLVSVLAPSIALLALALFYGLRELKGLRVCAPTELAHWLSVPVLTTSSWPRKSDALEALVDELADPALDALGTTLVLPLTELERPLAATLAAQLNARAQRHYRSLTGSRVTIAQNWQGELDSSRIKRASEVADRVLWVVAADAHRGEVLLRRRELVTRTDHVAAVLVDAEPGLARSVGDSARFWVTRPRELASVARAPAHAPLH